VERRKLIGKKIELARILKGMNRTELAKAIGVSDVSVGRWERGTQPVKIDKLYEIARALGQDVRDFLEETPPTLTELRLRAIPVLSQVGSAGVGSPSEDYVHVPNGVPRTHDVVGIEVVGDCLVPHIRSGDILVVDKDLSPQDGDVVVAVVEGACVVKRFRQVGDQAWLESNNDKVPAASAIIQGVAIMKSEPLRR